MSRITLEPGKRGGRPCIRGLRITVYDVLSMLSSGMSQQEILEDFPELTTDDIRAVLSYAADREHQVYSLNSAMKIEFDNAILALDAIASKWEVPLYSESAACAGVTLWQ